MTDVTRRAFLTRASVVGVGAAAVATGLAMPGSADAAEARSATDGHIDGRPPRQDVFLHIRDAKTAEVSIIVGDEEHVFHDQRLVDSVLRKFNYSAHTSTKE
jgi:hypothetical protein